MNQKIVRAPAGYFVGTTIQGQHLCSVREGSGFGAASVLQQAWAPLWAAILLAIAAVVLLYLRRRCGAFMVLLAKSFCHMDAQVRPCAWHTRILCTGQVGREPCS